MAKRMILMLAVVALVIGGLGFVKFRQIKAAVAAGSSFQPPPEAVTTTVAKQAQWPATLGAIGSVVAIRGVTVAADLPGIVDKIEFESGNWVKEGDVLVRLDTRQERAQLEEAEAQLEWARSNYARVQELAKQGVMARQEADRTIADQKQAEAKVVEMRATIGRKTIRAPFSGVLGIRQVNLGQYLSAGSPIVPLQSLDPIYVNFSVPQEAVARLKVGQSVRTTLKGATGIEFSGRVTAIDSVVDPSTRNVQVQATLPNRDGKLRPGMFVDTQLALGSSENVITLPISAINYAPYGDSVFVVGDMKSQNGQSYRGVRQQFVKLGEQRGDQVAVLTGLNAGEEVVTSGAFKLRNGAAVQPNNKVQPSNTTTPQVEDR
jgi:membrane fusion protein, multidrug efflux system